MTTNTDTDMDTIDPEPTPLTLLSGTPIKVNRLRTRETMKLLKILMGGAGDVLLNLRFDAETDSQEFVGTLLGAMLLSIPEKQDETIDFVRIMVSPASLIERPKSGPEHEVNAKLSEDLDAEMDNPELDDLLTIVEQVIKIEGPHILALGKRIALLLGMEQKKSEIGKPKTSSKKSSGS